MKMNIKRFYFTVIFFLPLFFYISCSTSPKNPGDIFILRNQAEAGLVAANYEASRGNFENSVTLLTEFKRSAVLTDDQSLIIRICLSLGNVLYSLGRVDEAFAQWDQALNEAVKLNNAELLSLSKIFYARGNLLSGKVLPESILQEIISESANIKKDKLYIAFSWQVRGLAFRMLNRWNDAENAIKQSLAIHEKAKSLENASYDWYTIASIRSLSGDTHGAIQALESSIVLDRRVENSWGLAASWRAMGDILRKTGRSGEASEAYLRSRHIYLAMNNEYEAGEIDKRMEMK